MSKYKVRHTFGDIVAKGTKAECELVLSAFDKYGVAHEFELVNPEHYEFELSDDIREEMVNWLSNEYAEHNCSMSILREEETWRLADYTDHDIMKKYEGEIYDSSECEYLGRAKKEFSDYIAEKIILED